MIRSAIALALCLSFSPAHACHRFSVWRYPTSQHCGVTIERGWYVEFVPSPLTEPDLRTPDQIKEQAEHDTAIDTYKDELNRGLNLLQEQEHIQQAH